MFLMRAAELSSINFVTVIIFNLTLIMVSQSSNIFRPTDPGRLLPFYCHNTLPESALQLSTTQYKLTLDSRDNNLASLIVTWCIPKILGG